MHIVNRATIREFSDKISVELNPMRFRPNIIIDGLDPWKEFDLVGRTLRVISSDGNHSSSSNSGGTIILKVLTKTIRCEGVGIDPSSNEEKINIPKLLNNHYPEYGPYLGVYASIEVTDGDDGNAGRLLTVGDTLELL